MLMRSLLRAPRVETTRLTASALLYYGIGLWAFSTVRILIYTFYAIQDTRTPVKVAIRAMLSNMVMNVLFVVPLVLLKVPGAHAGLALATALASYINAGLLYRHLRRDEVYHPHAGWIRLLLQILFAVTVMVALLLWGAPAADNWSAMSAAQRATSLGIWVAAGVVAYLSTLRLTGLRLSMLWAPAAGSRGAP